MVGMLRMPHAALDSVRVGDLVRDAPSEDPLRPRPPPTNWLHLTGHRMLSEGGTSGVRTAVRRGSAARSPDR
jgi:hypothetical protein